MKNILISCLVVATFGFIACEAPEAHEHEHAEEAIDMNALRTEIQGMEDAFAKAEMARDANSIVAYYADDAVSLPPERPAVVGKPAILARLTEEMANDSTTATKKYTVVDLWASGNLAVEVGKGVTTLKDGTQTTGKYISVFEKRDGKWLCIRDSYSGDAPEKE